jgi:hypothetical protein
VHELKEGVATCGKAEVLFLYLVNSGEVLRWDDILMRPSRWDES